MTNYEPAEPRGRAREPRRLLSNEAAAMTFPAPFADDPAGAVDHAPEVRRTWASAMALVASSSRAAAPPGNDDRVLRLPDLNRTCSIQRLKMNKGWTVFEIPSTPGRDFEHRLHLVVA